VWVDQTPYYANLMVVRQRVSFRVTEAHAVNEAGRIAMNWSNVGRPSRGAIGILVD
jgi:hypothetical protein